MDMTPPPSRVRLPCLAFNRGKYSDAPVLFNLSERKAVPSYMDELRGNTAWPTPHGWFLVRRPGTPATTTFLWNPSSNGGDKIQLPPLQEDVPDDCTCLLSDKPTAGGCVVLLLDRKLVITPAASCHGNFYFSTYSLKELGVIEFRRATTMPEFSSVAVREVVGAGEVYGVAHSALVFMVESKERLHMVNLLFEGSFSNVVYEVSVYRMDFATQQWCRVYDLDGQAFLLSATRFGASRPAAECGLEEDCVYVAYPWDRGLMVSNIKEGTMKVETIDEAPESGTPLWVLPAC
ncbi:unnamed protein product [Urochloa humidicola]